ncbi:hypothetical protein EMIT0P12_20032 [Pseudomonas sp. IT-P12]
MPPAVNPCSLKPKYGNAIPMDDGSGFCLGIVFADR